VTVSIGSAVDVSHCSRSIGVATVVAQELPYCGVAVGKAALILTGNQCHMVSPVVILSLMLNTSQIS
jgi:hypothetical protein